MLNLTKYNGMYYSVRNIVKVKVSKENKSVGIFMVNGDTDWIEFKTVEEAENTADVIAKMIAEGLK